MGRRREIRRCALQALYQFDAGMADRPDAVRATIDAGRGDESIHQRAFDLAMSAWKFRDEADRALERFSKDWPVYRQPMIDRNILRLAYYEMMHGDIPPKVAINEAVELAREFSTEKSYLFINGVLDRLYREIKERGATAPQPEEKT